MGSPCACAAVRLCARTLAAGRGLSRGDAVGKRQWCGWIAFPWPLLEKLHRKRKIGDWCSFKIFSYHSRCVLQQTVNGLSIWKSTCLFFYPPLIYLVWLRKRFSTCVLLHTPHIFSLAEEKRFSTCMFLHTPLIYLP